MKILLIQLRQLGDILLSTPCAREIKKSEPTAEISFLCHRMGEKILNGSVSIDRLYTYHESDSLSVSWSLIKKLRAERFDLAIDFMNNPRSALLCFLSGARTRLAFSSVRSFAYTQCHPRTQGRGYIVEEKFDLLKLAGFQPQDQSLELNLSVEDEAKARIFFATHENKPGEKLRIVLSPTHRRARRKWAPEQFVALAEKLVHSWQADIFWAWGPGEEEEVIALAKACRVKSFVFPATQLKELAAMIKACDLFIGNSNGPSHLAVAVNTPSLQLHGHTSASSWCPMTFDHRAIEAPKRSENPGDEMRTISLAMVWETLSDFLPHIRKRALLRKGPLQ